MTDNTRNEVNHLTAMAGEAPVTLAGHPARHITLETISVLDMCGSPIAAPVTAALNGKAEVAATTFRPHDVAVLAWAFCAPEDEVLEVALSCTPSFSEPAVKAALQFTRAWSLAELRSIIPHVEAEVRSLGAAFFESAAPDYGVPDAKKNTTASADSRS